MAVTFTFVTKFLALNTTENSSNAIVFRQERACARN